MTSDHVRPKVLGGDGDPENIVKACGGCNLSRGKITSHWAWQKQIVSRLQSWAGWELRVKKSHLRGIRRFVRATATVEELKERWRVKEQALIGWSPSALMAFFTYEQFRDLIRSQRGNAMPAHEQVGVKVNAMVDRGVAGLVGALNDVPGLTTLSSCQGDPGGRGYVAFGVGNDWRELGEFIGEFSAALGRDDSVNDLPFTLSIEWHAGGDSPTGHLWFPNRHLDRMTAAVQTAVALGLRSPGQPAAGP